MEINEQMFEGTTTETGELYVLYISLLGTVQPHPQGGTIWTCKFLGSLCIDTRSIDAIISYVTNLSWIFEIY